MSERKGDWFLTKTGRKFYPIDPLPEDVCLEDIAHSLSHICRFGGHCLKFYSVAQHSVIVSQIVSASAGRFPEHDGNPLQALMHDATEAYVGDMVRPLKAQMHFYQEVEKAVWKAICRRFGLAVVLPPGIKAADNRALMTERRDLLVKSDYPWSLEKEYPPIEAVIEPLPPQEAKALFLERYAELGGPRG